MDPKPPATLDDVARAAGVSTATVSRCLNTASKVSAATRERVMRAVDTLGYTPNFGARALAAKRTATVGAIVPTLENAIFARGLQAFQEALHDRGYTLLVSSTAYQADREAEQVKALVARGAEALLLIGLERDQAVYDVLAGRGIPAVAAWTYQPDAAVPTVGFDNYKAMRALAEAVFARGHREVAVISGISAGNDRVMARNKGILDAAAAVGVPTESLPIIETAYGIAEGGDAFCKLWCVDAPPTAVLCMNDVLAAGALQRAREMGVAVPDDVSITGFDDMDLATLVTPQLTTVHVPHRKMGQVAAETLVRMLQGEGEPACVPLDAPLVLRGSLGPKSRTDERVKHNP